MARHHLEKSLSKKEQSPDDVWTRYEYVSQLVAEERIRIEAEIARGSASLNPIYTGMTPNELAAFFEIQQAEVDNGAMLSLFAATEAALKVDYVRRVMRRKKDPVSREFKRVYREVGLKVALKIILQTWKENPPTPAAPAAVASFRGAFHLRNWLAHGRYRRSEFARKYDPIVVLEVCQTLLRELGLR